MTLKKRITELERLKPEAWNNEPIMIFVRNLRRDAKPIPVERFTLSAGGKKMAIQRLPNESEEVFIDRAKEIGKMHAVKPLSHHDTPPSVILFHNVKNSPVA